MNVNERNALFLKGITDTRDLFPKLESLSAVTVVFDMDFGLSSIPTEPGIMMLRGGRQLGKSTWMEQQIKSALKAHGAGAALFINGDELDGVESLYQKIRDCCSLFPVSVKNRRLFIDEITSVSGWEKALKRAADEGIVKNVLVITTGSKSTDLRRGTERLPGRKGKLSRTAYRFLPVGFAEFERKTKEHFKEEDTILAYILTGGSPVAINELIEHGFIPEYVVELARDWIFGETQFQNRSIELQKRFIQLLFKHGGLPLSQSSIARETGMANNTVAHGYAEVLKDLGCISESIPLEANHLRSVSRKASKFHVIFPLMIAAFHPSRPRSIENMKKIWEVEKGKLAEWLVAGKLWRESAIAGDDAPENQYYWKNKNHEIDFITYSSSSSGRPEFIEVKAGKSDAAEFLWFRDVFPEQKLKIISESEYENAFSSSESLVTLLRSKTR
ncbi:MAG: hypothetical protein A2583_08430 [Bdellovibrionales bacterium RIFOXYD1_FULL_53_11]|nr:MAG: hypothetical protein A2583_08430 [Bdellovibrionales bacterium RIFOXYD1_FULL_53_11]